MINTLTPLFDDTETQNRLQSLGQLLAGRILGAATGIFSAEFSTGLEKLLTSQDRLQSVISTPELDRRKIDSISVSSLPVDFVGLEGFNVHASTQTKFERKLGLPELPGVPVSLYSVDRLKGILREGLIEVFSQSLGENIKQEAQEILEQVQVMEDDNPSAILNLYQTLKKYQQTFPKHPKRVRNIIKRPVEAKKEINRLINEEHSYIQHTTTVLPCIRSDNEQQAAFSAVRITFDPSVDEVFLNKVISDESGTLSQSPFDPPFRDRFSEEIKIFFAELDKTGMSPANINRVLKSMQEGRFLSSRVIEWLDVLAHIRAGYGFYGKNKPVLYFVYANILPLLQSKNALPTDEISEYLAQTIQQGSRSDQELLSLNPN